MLITIKNKFSHLLIIGLLLGLGGCAKHKKKEEMTLEELSSKARACIEKEKNDEAIGYLEEIMARYADHQNIAQYKMMLAEVYFKDNRHAAAQEVYEHFTQFYPSDEKAEYAKYKSILAMFYQTLRTDCDQTETQNTLDLCKDYLTSKNFNKYRKDVLDIQQTCQKRLIDKEVYVFNFYLNQGKLEAAKSRLKALREKYLAIDQTLEPQIIYLETKLAHKEKDKKQLQAGVAILSKKYPKSHFAKMAADLTRKNAFIF